MMITPTSKKIHEIWESGFVNRWHSNPCYALRNSQDTTDAHSNRVAKLVLLFRTAVQTTNSRYHLASELEACVMHDAPEIFTGDVGNPAKRRNPDLKAILKRVEEEWLRERGFILDETALMKMCDLLDAILFAKKHAPNRVLWPDWIEDIKRCVEWADSLGVGSVVLELINEESS